MTPLQRYIAEEIATDHVDGLLSRREAMRRLALLGVSAASATALIAACSDERGATPASSIASGSTGTPASAAGTAPGMEEELPTTDITWAGPAGELKGAWAEAADPKGAVLVIHENKGLNSWVRTVAGRLAGVGYSALAIDLLSEEGGTATFTDPAEATAALGKVDPQRFVADLKSGVEELGRRAPGKKLAVVGFCFGGGLTWQLLAAGEPQLAAAVPFYGPFPDGADLAGSKANVLGFYGALDTRVTSTQDAAKTALDKAGLNHLLVVEPNADHAFFNDSGPRYNAEAAADAWQKLQEWFGKYLV
ncbi:dienelactone hydrolase family protein [Mycolicibacterium komossense]|uniref:Dienelactone hydrolase family protein n=1 Tax=Mycolicibacterium komossense TaxID=1779 RepID=A0ABT3CAQ0_9MYCO|nr:dienelactone hydrolase family protein [Mycolicibacterium komossense]MCV7226321.1 dienelactone hydrolase family protein [Mycolicibacterium komossense]